MIYYTRVLIDGDTGIYWKEAYSSNYLYHCQRGTLFDNFKSGFMRIGLPPKGRSFNHREMHYESGISCYKCLFRGQEVVPILPSKLPNSILERALEGAPVIILSGKVIKKLGGDGEPLLENVRIIELGYLSWIINFLPFSPAI